MNANAETTSGQPRRSQPTAQVHINELKVLVGRFGWMHALRYDEKRCDAWFVRFDFAVQAWRPIGIN